MKTSMYRIIIITIVGSLVGPPLPCFCAPSEWVQWDVSSGGNGHWYKAVPGFSGLTWTVASQQAQAEGGYLATITSAAENAFVFSLVADDLRFWNGSNWSGPALGGFHPDGSHDRASGWCWVTGEPWTYSNWWYGQPDHGWPIEDRMSFYGGRGGGGPGSMWNDLHRDNTNLGGYVIESIGPLMETSSFQSTLVETLFSQKGILDNGQVIGDMNGVFDFNNFDAVTINTGPWAGKGFSKGQFQATLEGATYKGIWHSFLLPKPQERKIYLKGSTSGEIAATVEGYLTESVPDSNVYDHYQATWKIGRLGNTTTSAVIDVNGTLSYQSSSEFPATELYILQSSMDGTVSGHYAGPLSAVINHIRIADSNNPYYGEGFSIISYVSEPGQGDGWTYDKVTSPGIVEMKGLFDSPLFGIVSATLDETKTPRTLFATIERIDLGLPPMADLEVTTWGPTRVSPGQTINLIVEYRNQGLTNAYDTVVVAQLPSEVNYVSSTNGGIYRWETHEVFWKLGTVPPKTKGNLSTTIMIQWGLPWGTQLETSAVIDTTGAEIDKYLDPNNSVDNLQEYLTYSPIMITTTEQLSPEQFIQLLSSDPEFNDTYDYAQELGFIDANTPMKITLGDGTFIFLVPMIFDSTTEDIVFVIKFSNEQSISILMKIDKDSISFFDRENGFKYDSTTDTFSSWGERGSCTWPQCINNCIGEKLRSFLVDQGLDMLLRKWWGRVRHSLDFGTWLGFFLKCYDPPPYQTPEETQMNCNFEKIYRERALNAALSVAGQPAGLIYDLFIKCGIDCAKNKNAYGGQTCTLCYRCSRGMYPGYNVPFHWNDCELIQLYVGEGTLPPIYENYYEKWGISNEVRAQNCWLQGKVCRQIGRCSGQCVEPRNADLHDSTVAVARDPNRKLGPDGRVLPGQTLNYMVEYENEGEGIAFGVYFTDTLYEDLDDSTLEIWPVFDANTNSQIAPTGTYNPATRTITWFVGQVDPNQGGYTAISANVKSDAPLRAEIINFATVYFPSVPEETRTNGVVSIVIPFGDIDQDGDVDFGDYAILANQWLQLPAVPSADIAPQDGDDIVDWQDLSELATHWLEGTTP